MRPNSYICKKLKEYDRKLFVKWDYEMSRWELWRKMPWGDRLVTPISEFIYDVSPGISDKFCPLDNRILDWVYSSDPFRKDLKLNWKWARDKRFKQHKLNQSKKYRQKIFERALDSYNMVNNEIINPIIDDQDYLRPDVKNTRGRRTMLRSAENAREYFGDNNPNN